MKKVKPENVFGKPWEKLSMDERAQYACKYDKKRLKEIDVSKIEDRYYQAYTIGLYPKAADTFDINLLDGVDLSIHLLTMAPKLIKKVDKSRYPELCWGSILEKHPHLAKYCDFSWLGSFEWYTLLDKRPEFVDYFKPEYCKKYSDWRWILMGYPKLWRKCPFNSFSRKEQLYVAAVSMPLFRKLGVTKFTVDDWLSLFESYAPFSNDVFKVLAKNLVRLSGKLKQ